MQLNHNIQIVKIWFIVNAVVALFPPIYWMISDGNVHVFGVPASLLYFLAVSFSIMLSIIYAYCTDVSTGNF
jgi:hypothetical protein